MQNKDFSSKYSGPCIYVKSKSDLSKNNNNKLSNKFLSISSLKNNGIDELLTNISTFIVDNYSFVQSAGSLVSKRQRYILNESERILSTAINQLNQNVGMDVVASTLNGFVYSINDIIGEISDKDVINNIFNNFCVGK